MAEDVHKYPSQTAERFQVRMPDGLRDRIAAAAAGNNRSMNSEIVAALEALYPARDTVQEVIDMSRKIIGVAEHPSAPPKIEELREVLKRFVDMMEDTKGLDS